MGRSLSIAAYLAGRSDRRKDDGFDGHPPRPDGTVIWARCSDPDQLTAIETLARKLTEDGDPIHVIATVPKWNAALASRALPEPKGRKNTKDLLQHWKPAVTIWVKGNLNPIMLAECRAAKVPCLLVDATAEGLENVSGSWVPGAMRSLLSQFEAVLALDQTAAEGLIHAGAPQEIIRVTGPMEDCAPPLPCSETERQELARAIGSRPIWLAAAADFAECAWLSRAQRDASHRTHRLLSIIVPRDLGEAPKFLAQMKAAGLAASLRSEEPEITDVTQVHIVDTDEDLGLWYRIAPMTYLGGTLTGAVCRDPFEPAALGSAVIYGPQVAPYQRHAARLNAAGASRLIRSESDLGPTIDSLLSTERVARLAHAAWDVTSRGADVTNKVVRMIQRRLDEAGY